MNKPGRPLLRNLVFVFVSLFVFAVAAEFLLRLFIPFHAYNVSGRICPGARYYGWANCPSGLIASVDPDNGKISISRQNRRGWRDIERSYANTRNSFRILVLGDSNAFGLNVPFDRIFTRRLKKRFLDDGYNVEVLNMSVFGWGTDQQLEALKREGRLYKPDVVVLFMTGNDIRNNVSSNPAGYVDKPFRYEVKSGKLVRSGNKGFKPAPMVVSWFATRTQIGQRLFYLYKKRGGRSQEDVAQNRGKTSYVANPGRIEKISFIEDIDEGDPLIAYLKSNIYKPLDKNELKKKIDSSGHGSDTERIMRMCEDRYFNSFYLKDGYYPDDPEKVAENWRVFEALVREMSGECRRMGADFVVTTDTDDSVADWFERWGIIKKGEPYRSNLLFLLRNTKKIAIANGGGFVSYSKPISRFKTIRIRIPTGTGSSPTVCMTTSCAIIKRNYPGT